MLKRSLQQTTRFVRRALLHSNCPSINEVKQPLSKASMIDSKVDSPLLPSTITSSRDMSGFPKAMSATFWDKPMLSQDYIIIGAGIIGLTTAINIKQLEPSAKVLVLEKGTLPKGASTRNAGFTCFGSLTEILDDINKMGEENARLQVRDRWEGLKLLREYLGDEAIGFRQTGNYELITESLLPQLKNMDRVNSLLKPIFGEDVFIRRDENIEKFGFSKQYIKALVLNKFEGELDSGMMMKALQDKALSLKIDIRYGSEASRPRNINHGLEIQVRQHGNPIHFQAKAAAVCVNGYSSTLLPEFGIKPGRGQILVTAPLKRILFDAPCHLGEGYWYFRPLPGNRILLGGGRNLNFSQETTTELVTTPDIMGPLKEILNQIIAPEENPKIEYAWAGLMGFSPDHQPKIAVVPGQPHLVIGFGCNGMGVARGFHTGQKTAILLKANKAFNLKLENDIMEQTEISSIKNKI